MNYNTLYLLNRIVINKKDGESRTSDLTLTYPTNAFESIRDWKAIFNDDRTSLIFTIQEINIENGFKITTLSFDELKEKAVQELVAKINAYKLL